MMAAGQKIIIRMIRITQLPVNSFDEIFHLLGINHLGNIYSFPYIFIPRTFSSLARI